VEVYLECGAKLVFACALEWPGWCRSGKSEDLALEALTRYAPRYGSVVTEAGLVFDVGPEPELVVRERLEGTTTTDFGAPAAVAGTDKEPLTQTEATRLEAILRAGWTIFDRVVAIAPAELRKGVRGGGRERDAIADHVVAAEYAYARKLDLRDFRRPPGGDAEALGAMRNAIAERLTGGADDSPWPRRYAARRLTWHVLDHAWEIEDRSAPAPFEGGAP